MVAAVAMLESHKQAPNQGLTGKVVIGDQRGATMVEVDQIRLGRRGLTFRFPWSIETGKHAWVEVVLPTGKRIRPLVAVLSACEGSISARFVHIFPEHQRALDSHLASATGY